MPAVLKFRLRNRKFLEQLLTDTGHYNWGGGGEEMLPVKPATEKIDL